MLRLLTHFLLIIALVTGSSAFADEKRMNNESLLFTGFKAIDRFGLIDVSLDGSAEKLGFKKEELADYLRLRFKNSFSGIGFKEPENILEIFQDTEKAKKFGHIHVRVWTVGDDYPIAYHIMIDAGSFAKGREYQDAILGYGSKRNIADFVRESISKLVDDLAVVFFKARSDL